MANGFVTSSPIYDIKDLEAVLDTFKSSVEWVSTGRKERKVEYLNIPIALDIETTSFIQNGEKKAYAYQYQFGINGRVFFFRTSDDLIELMTRLSTYYNLNDKRRIVVFIENASYEFQFIRKYFTWTQVFSLDERRPVRAVTDEGIEFRCSYILSGYGLDSLGKNLTKYPVSKLTGQYDYSKFRHSLTPLTSTENLYCENDVRVVMAYIQEKIESDGNIGKILLTKTSYVRQYVRNHTIYSPDKTTRYEYKKLIKHLTMEPYEYILAREAFAGGFTHANAEYVDETIENVDSIDFTSSYPAVMVAFPYPMSKGQSCTIRDNDHFKTFLRPGILSIFKIKITNLIAKPDAPDNIISLSKCYLDEEHTKPARKHDCVTNNGRVVMSLVPLYTTITNVDFENYQKFYDFDYEVSILYSYRAGYLPKAFIECILHFYKQKTTLKGISGKESEYQQGKEMLNSTYGMTVTDICRDEIIYGTDWGTVHPTKADMCDIIDKYNNNKSRFLSYIWGVFITAYARRNVFTGILEFNNDYVYCDTDSNKVLHIENHMDYINRYNDWITTQINTTLTYYGLDINDAAPLDIKGNAHPLGVWDWETEGDPYLKFKTLGAKRYLTYQKKKGYSMTVAGLPKSSGHLDDNNKMISTIDKLVADYGEDNIFDAFNSDMVVTPDQVCKNILTYVDEPCFGVMTDYLGTPAFVRSESYIYMSNEGFRFSRDDAFIDYLLGKKTERSY